MEDDHPSFAVLAFVAAMSVLGRGEVRGDRRRFRYAVSTVIDDDALIKFVVDHCYGSRSLAAHADGLFGGESVLRVVRSSGLFNPGEHWRAPRMAYRLRLLAAQALGRRLGDWTTARSDWPSDDLLATLLWELNSPPVVLASVEL